MYALECGVLLHVLVLWAELLQTSLHGRSFKGTVQTSLGLSVGVGVVGVWMLYTCMDLPASFTRGGIFCLHAGAGLCQQNVRI